MCAHEQMKIKVLFEELKLSVIERTGTNEPSMETEPAMPVNEFMDQMDRLDRLSDDWDEEEEDNDFCEEDDEAPDEFF